MSGDDAELFAAHRPDLVAYAYRMLGDVGRAEDIAQEAWLRWQRRDRAVAVASPRAYLVTIVSRLCLTELGSARARREESRGDRLPEPVATGDAGLRVEALDQVSMALLVVLSRLTPAERAVLLLHDVFDFSHQEIAGLVGRSAPACRKLLERARREIEAERRVLAAPREEHQRLLRAFAAAASAGDVAGLVDLLAADAVLISDGGARGVRGGGLRNLQKPLRGAAQVAAFVAAATTRGGAELRVEERELNGSTALVFWRDGRVFAALLLATADEKVHRVFFHADPERLSRVA